MTSVSPPVYNDRYELSHQIARGGMAEVYLAHDLLLDRPVALKVLFPELSVDRSFVERFRREAQAAANLSHPNIVSIYDWGQADHTYFIVMEYVAGQPLSAIIRNEGPLQADRAAVIGAEVAAALAFAHGHGVVHRDVKPGNVLIAEDGVVKVTDFGIARAANAVESLTQTGAVMGTATYFSPEQAQGLGVDGRSDVYSLGVVLYEMVTGQPPFSAENPISVAYKHVREDPRPVRQVNPEVPAAFEAVVTRAMAKDADRRYQNAAELRDDLLRYQQGRTLAPTVAAGATATAVQGAVGDTTMVSTPEEHTGDYPAVEDERRNRRNRLLILLLVLLLIALGLAVYFVGRNFGLWGSSTAATIKVPSVQGQNVNRATATLRSDGLTWKLVDQANPAAKGVVFDQNPKPPVKLPKNGRVVLDVSTGPVMVKLPDVRGQDLTTATNTLTGAGFKVNSARVSSSQAVGTVVDQSPSAGSSQPKGSTIKLSVSGGPSQISVPDVTGESQTAAAADLGHAGLSVGSVTNQASSSVSSGLVISTNPPGGHQVAPNASVDLVVSSGPSQISIPDVRGQPQSTAGANLSSAGFKVAVQGQSVTEPSQAGIVLRQSPAGGTSAASGSTVTIVVGQYNPPSTTTSAPAGGGSPGGASGKGNSPPAP